jgi:hypothetical protein
VRVSHQAIGAHRLASVFVDLQREHLKRPAVAGTGVSIANGSERTGTTAVAGMAVQANVYAVFDQPRWG